MDRTSLTSCASQPLKTLAKCMHVNSSYRIEKKISQAVEELGLFPMISLMDSLINEQSPLAKKSPSKNMDNDCEVGHQNSRLGSPSHLFIAESELVSNKSDEFYDSKSNLALKSSPFDRANSVIPNTLTSNRGSITKRRSNKANCDCDDLNGLIDG